MNDALSTRPADPGRKPSRAAGIVLFLSACAGPLAVPDVAWLPEAEGWAVRDVDEASPPRWVLYDRDAREADVKALRIVGIVDAPPAAVAAALRHRLLDPSTIPENTTREILRDTPTEVVTHGRSSLPWPFDDREVTERLRFTANPQTGVYVVDAVNIDPGTPAEPGVLRIPLVHNRFTIAPAGVEGSAVTMDTVHDLGGHFPNWLIYGPVSDFLVKEVAALEAMTSAPKTAAR